MDLKEEDMSEDSVVVLEDGTKISLKELKIKYLEQQRVITEQSNLALMGEVIPMIAHQWQQPLQTISILVQKIALTNMLDDSLKDEFLENTVKDVSSQLKYMSRTIDDFRNFFVPKKDKKVVKCSKLSQDAQKFLNLMFKFDEIDFKVETIKDVILRIHTNEIIHVFINILKNARDAMIENSIKNREIIIVNSCDDKFAIIEIKDNAGGIPVEIIDNIFKSYFSTKREKKGTGLGLYMCRKIVEENYFGTIDVKNGEKGAIFTIKLPLN